MDGLATVLASPSDSISNRSFPGLFNVKTITLPQAGSDPLDVYTLIDDIEENVTGLVLVKYDLHEDMRFVTSLLVGIFSALGKPIVFIDNYLDQVAKMDPIAPFVTSWLTGWDSERLLRALYGK